jgi:hypothetical protein
VVKTTEQELQQVQLARPLVLQDLQQVQLARPLVLQDLQQVPLARPLVLLVRPLVPLDLQLVLQEFPLRGSFHQHENEVLLHRQPRQNLQPELRHHQCRMWSQQAHIPM